VQQQQQQQAKDAAPVHASMSPAFASLRMANAAANAAAMLAKQPHATALFARAHDTAHTSALSQRNAHNKHARRRSAIRVQYADEHVHTSDDGSDERDVRRK
jgi:hypothetical protein